MSSADASAAPPDPTVDDIGAATRISADPDGSRLRGIDMTMINTANLRTAAPSWDLDTRTFTSAPTAFTTTSPAPTITASLATIAEPTQTELDDLDALDELDALEELFDEPSGSSYARCSDGHGTLSHLFFSDDDFDIARAKAICSKCGLSEACLAGALERAEFAGVWGGQLIEDGQAVALKRRRGRPPKVARPVLVVDEVPLPPHLVA
jgi:WhiB family redox-sensing transcriptional regulator